MGSKRSAVRGTHINVNRTHGSHSVEPGDRLQRIVVLNDESVDQVQDGERGRRDLDQAVQVLHQPYVDCEKGS